MSISADLNKLGSLDIYTANNAVCSDVATVLEDVVGKSTYCHLNTTLSVSVESMQFKVTRNHPSHMVAVCRRASSGAKNIRGQLVQLLAVLVGDNGTSCGSCVCSEANSAIENDAADRRSCLSVVHLCANFCLGHQSCVADAVFVVKATEWQLFEVIQLHHYCFRLRSLII